MNDLNLTPDQEKTVVGAVAVGLVGLLAYHYVPATASRIPVEQAVAVAVAVALVGAFVARVVWRVRRETRAVKTTVANVTKKDPDDVQLRRVWWSRRGTVERCRANVHDWKVPDERRRRQVVHQLRLDGWEAHLEPHKRRLSLIRRHPVALPTLDRLDVAERPRGMALRLGTMRDPETGEPTGAYWNPESSDPHCLVTGATGQGKSVCLNALITQAVADGWTVLIADPKDMDTRWAQRLPNVHRFAGENAPEALDAARDELDKRRDWFAKHAPETATKLADLPNPEYGPALIVVDEVVELISMGDKQRRERSQHQLMMLATLCRAQSMALCVALQRPDAALLGGVVRSNLGARVLMGEGSPQHLDMTFGSREVCAIDSNVRGRGRAQLGSRAPVEFQGTYVDPAEVVEAYGAPVG